MKRMQRSPGFRPIAVAVGACVLAVFGFAAPGSSEPRAPAPEPVTVAALAAAQAPAAGAPGGGRIVRFTMANTPKIDPAVGSDGSSSSALVNLYDSLIFPEYDGSVSPLLASGWSVSSDGLTYTFRLRTGAKFHNGKEVTADDVVFSMERMLTIKQGYAFLFTGRVKSVSAPDKSTVRFQLEKPFGPFLPTLSRLYILNKDQVMAHLQPGQYGDKQDYGRAWLAANDAGSGPYQVKELRQNEYLLAERFQEYWGGFKPGNPDGFKLIGSTEPVMVRTLMSRKELDIADEYQPMENYRSFARMPGVEVVNYATGKLMYVATNTAKPPTDDIHFRKALAYIIDYDTLTKMVFPDTKPAVGPVSAALPGHDAKLPAARQDLDAAKRELAQSKYAGKLDQYPVDLVWVAETPDREKLALSIQADAAKVGIKVNVVKTPWVSVVEQASKPESTPMACTVVVSPNYSEAGALLGAAFHSNATGRWENMTWSKNAEIDRLIEEAIQTTDRQQRFERYAVAQRRIMEIFPTIPVFEAPEKRAYQASYMSWQPAELMKAGKPVLAVMGYLNYMRNIEYK